MIKKLVRAIRILIWYNKRLLCVARNQHKWEERTIIRWCVKCLWMQIKDPTTGWIYYDPEHYDSDWMTWQDQKIIADELLEYLEFSETRFTPDSPNRR